MWKHPIRHLTKSAQELVNRPSSFLHRNKETTQKLRSGLHVVQDLCHDKQADVQEGLVQFFPALLQHLPHTARASFFQTLTQSLSLDSATWRCRIGLADQLHTLAALEVQPPTSSSQDLCAVLCLSCRKWCIFLLGVAGGHGGGGGDGGCRAVLC